MPAVTRIVLMRAWPNGLPNERAMGAIVNCGLRCRVALTFHSNSQPQPQISTRVSRITAVVPKPPPVEILRSRIWCYDLRHDSATSNLRLPHRDQPTATSDSKNGTTNVHGTCPRGMQQNFELQHSANHRRNFPSPQVSKFVGNLIHCIHC